MKYVVIFKSDDGRMHVKNEIFNGLLDAETYADTIDASRNPIITPYLPMNPGGKGEFTVKDHKKMGDMLEELRMLLLFSYDDHGTDLVAAHHICQALNNVSNAVHSYHMAALCQKEEK